MARGIPDSDSVPRARATTGFPLCLPPGPTPAVRIPQPRTPPVPGPRVAGVGPLAADPFRPRAARPGASALPPPADAPVIAGTRGSSTLHWAVSTPATHRRCVRSRSLRDRKSPAQSHASGSVRWGRTCVRKRSGIRACDWGGAAVVRARHNVQDHGARGAQQSHAARKSVFALLPAGAEHTHQDLLSARSFPGPVPAPHLTGDHHAADGAFRRIVGGVQSRTAQKREQPQQLMFEMTRQPPVGCIPATWFQQPFQLGFQFSGGAAQAARGDLTPLMTVAMPISAWTVTATAASTASPLACPAR